MCSFVWSWKNTICMTVFECKSISEHTAYFRTTYLYFCTTVHFIWKYQSSARARCEPEQNHKSVATKLCFGSYLWALITNWLQGVNTTFLSAEQHGWLFSFGNSPQHFPPKQGTEQCQFNSFQILHTQTQGTLAARLGLLQQFSNTMKTIS